MSNKEIIMADVWGLDAVPQSYTRFSGFMHDNGNYSGDCYGLIFMTKEAAEAQAHAVRNHDQLAGTITEQEKVIGELVSAFRLLHLDIVNKDASCVIDGDAFIASRGLLTRINNAKHKKLNGDRDELV